MTKQRLKDIRETLEKCSVQERLYIEVEELLQALERIQEGLKDLVFYD